SHRFFYVGKRRAALDQHHADVGRTATYEHDGLARCLLATKKHVQQILAEYDNLFEVVAAVFRVTSGLAEQLLDSGNVGTLKQIGGSCRYEVEHVLRVRVYCLDTK